MLRNRAVSLALVGLFVWVTGCSSYTQIGIGEVADHGKVRVTTTDGERETIRNPWVDADSVKGHEKHKNDRYRTDPIVVIPLDQIETLEASHVSAVKTVGLVFGIAAVLVGVAALACCPGLNPLEGLGEPDYY